MPGRRSSAIAFNCTQRRNGFLRAVWHVRPMAKDNVFKFRTVKWGDPARKFKMIPNEVPEEMKAFYFAVLAVGVGALAFATVFVFML